MAGLYVRDLTRAWLTALPGIAFYDTINKVQSPPEPVWMTVEFFAGRKEGTINCPGYSEYGVIDLVFLATPGSGDGPLLTALEPAVVEFLNMKDPTNRLTLIDSETVREMSGGAGDSYYRMGVGVNYVYTT